MALDDADAMRFTIVVINVKSTLCKYPAYSSQSLSHPHPFFRCRRGVGAHLSPGLHCAVLVEQINESLSENGQQQSNVSIFS